MYKLLLRPILFSFSAEKAHHIAFDSMSALFKVPGAAWLTKKLFSFSHPSLEREVFGLRFPNPVGLAAGFDKDGRLVDELACLGFGFIEVGTATPLPQDGNPLPRLFRLQADKGIINRMGFNNQGLEALRQRLQRRKSTIIIGGNIGKNKVTPNEEAVNDYVKGYDALYEVVDYFVVNVSSPNTPNLRELQEKAPLTHLLRTLQERNMKKAKPKPILLKIAPDLNQSQLDDIIEIVQETGIAGIIATNTTISREGLQTPTAEVESIGNGGLSGAPLTKKSTEVIRYLHQKSGGKIPIIGVGGIFTAQDAQEKLDAGASLVQVYSGFIYEGPSMIGQINKGLLKAQQ